MDSFSSLPLHPTLQKNLERHNLKTPTPVQAGSIPPALDGRDVVATAQTGTGKTLAFALPILQKLVGTNGNGPIRAVILSPTRELAIQIEETFTKLTAGTPVRTAVVVGGMSEFKQLKTLKRGVQVVIATPGRLCDFLDRRLVKLDQVQQFVLDEADRMLDMGFLPSIKDILSATPETKQTLLFSATIEKSVAHLIESYVKNPARISIGATTKTADFVDLHHYEVSNAEKLSLLSHLLRADEGSFLVFARTKHGTDRLADQLSDAGFKSTRIHGNRTQAQRNQALEGFKRGQYRVLVATDVAARGIHVDGIAHVVNYDLPQVPEDFIHRVGRTGRAGARGTASTFSTRQERGEIRRIEKAISLRLQSQELPSLEEREIRRGKPASARMEAAPAAAPETFVEVSASLPREKRRSKGHFDEMLASAPPEPKQVAMEPVAMEPIAIEPIVIEPITIEAIALEPVALDIAPREAQPSAKRAAPHRKSEKPLWNQPLASKKQLATRPFSSEEFRQQLLADEAAFYEKPKDENREERHEDERTFADKHFERKKKAHQAVVAKKTAAKSGFNAKRSFGAKSSFGPKPKFGPKSNAGPRSNSDSKPSFGPKFGSKPGGKPKFADQFAPADGSRPFSKSGPKSNNGKPNGTKSFSKSFAKPFAKAKKSPYAKPFSAKRARFAHA